MLNTKPIYSSRAGQRAATSLLRKPQSKSHHDAFLRLVLHFMDDIDLENVNRKKLLERSILETFGDAIVNNLISGLVFLQAELGEMTGDEAVVSSYIIYPLSANGPVSS